MFVSTTKVVRLKPAGKNLYWHTYDHNCVYVETYERVDACDFSPEKKNTNKKLHAF